MNSRNTTAALFVIALCVLLIRCKSPEGSKNTGTTITSDTSHTQLVDTGITSSDTTQTQPVTAEDSATTSQEPITNKKAKTSGNKKTLTVIIKNLASATAPVTVSVYGTKNKFPKPKNELKVYKFKPHGKVLTAEIKDLPYGTYAIATYQDVNKSSKIDQNPLGVPKEPYAFSNNYKPVVKAPNFDDCKFDYNERSNSISINMIR